jgi:hypothetical protein
LEDQGFFNFGYQAPQESNERDDVQNFDAIRREDIRIPHGNPLRWLVKRKLSSKRDSRYLWVTSYNAVSTQPEVRCRIFHAVIRFSVKLPLRINVLGT